MGTQEAVAVVDIVMDILSRLPVESLLRFKCVSKFWKTLISEPYFKKKHLNFHSKNENSHKMLFGQRGTTFNCFNSSSFSSVQIVKDIHRLDLPSKSMTKVYYCCDGLFLVRLQSRDTGWRSLLMLWNPSTRESTILPHIDFSDESSFGLGYDSTTDDYKVLKIDREHDVFKILALKSGSWRKLKIGRYCLTSYWRSLAFLHGAFHWKGFSAVGTLNISNEMYGQIPTPEIELPYPLKYFETDVSVLNGMLCIYFKDNIYTDVWVMKDYGIKDSWTKLFRVLTFGTSLKLLYRFSNGEVLLKYTTNLGNKIHKISDGRPSNRIWPSDSDGIDANTILDVFVYTESLISPKLKKRASLVQKASCSRRVRAKTAPKGV